MVKCYLNLSIFTVFLKNKNTIFKIRRSKVTDYAPLKGGDKGSSESTLVKNATLLEITCHCSIFSYTLFIYLES